MLTLRKEHRLRVFENRLLWRIFGHKRDDVTVEWRKQHNEELSNLYSSPYVVCVTKSRRMEWAGHVAHMGERRVVHRVVVGKLEGRRPIGKPRLRGRIILSWIFRRWDVGAGRYRWRAIVNAVLNLWVP